MTTSFLNWLYVGSSPTGDTMQDLSFQGEENLEKLVKLIKARLHSSGKVKSQDNDGNVVYLDHDIFAPEMLEAFVALSISQFNQTPYFTFFSLNDTEFVDTFTDVLVMGAVLHALASQSLLERGREFTFSQGDGDAGIVFSPPSLAEMLNTQWATLLNHHHIKLKEIKSEISSFTSKKQK